MLYTVEKIHSDMISRIWLKNVITGKVFHFTCSNKRADHFLHAACNKGTRFISTVELVEEYGEEFVEYPNMNIPKGMDFDEWWNSTAGLKYRAADIAARANDKIWEQRMVEKYQKDNVIICNDCGLGEPITQPDCYIRKLNIFQVLWYRFGIIKDWVKE